MNKDNLDLSSSSALKHVINNGTKHSGPISVPHDYDEPSNRGRESSNEDMPQLNISGPSFFKILLFIIFAVAVVLILRMNQLSYQRISEEQALAMSQEVIIATPNQQITMLNTDSVETCVLQQNSTVKVLGIYKHKLNKGESPLSGDNPVYLMELHDGTRGYGSLAEAPISPSEGDSMRQCVTYQDKGFFLFPKYQTWNEFMLPGWLRTLLTVLAYIIGIVLIYKLWTFMDNRATIRKAKRGNAKACYWVGSCFEYGYGIADDYDFDQALLWYKKSADQGYGRACAHLGLMYEQGRYPSDIPVEQHCYYLYIALEYYETGATKGNKECKKSFERLKKLLNSHNNFGDACLDISLGRGVGYYNMGICYLKGYRYDDAYLPPNANMAVRLFQKAIDMADKDEQGEQWASETWNSLGLCYINGTGVEKDAQKAVRMLKRAAELGNAEALFNLAVAYYNGEGVPLNESEAIRLWKQSARMGFEEAIKILKELGESY